MPAEQEKRIAAARPVLLDHIAYFASNLGKVESNWKYDNTRVTEADLALSKSILGAIGKLFPGDDTVSEEDLPPAGTPPRPLRQRFCWVLDPIDGTNNYAAGLPACGILLGLLDDGLPVYGWIYDHLGKRLVEGGPGRGVRVDGIRHTPPPPAAELGRHDFVSLHFPLPDEYLHRLEPLLRFCTARCMGSSATHLTYNALGCFTGSFSLRGKVWDVAAGHAILAGAGRRVIFPKTDPFPLREISNDPPSLPHLAGTEAFLRFALPLFQ
jgi:myo-inositol-1(or 4)-monophosphatase